MAVLALVVTGCGGLAATRATQTVRTTGTGPPAALVRERRPIGHGRRFEPPVRGAVTGACRAVLGPRYGVHVELFAANRVVLVAAGIGTVAPITRTEGRITRARCYGDVVTLEPTGVVLVRPGRRLTLATLFRAWGQPLGDRRLASFRAPPGQTVTVFIGGRQRPGPPGAVPLTRDAELVLEVGPHVPPHSTYTFPPGS